MQRVQTFWLLISIATVFISACTNEKSKTVSEYLHDIDAAKVAIKQYDNDRGNNQNNPDFINALAAKEKIQFLNECWHKKDSDRFTTANTDHGCLDNKGYKR